jgi:tricorn protease-like protein
MTVDQAPTVGVYFGTTGGELWGSRDEGRTWRCLVRHLPHIYAVEVA